MQNDIITGTITDSSTGRTLFFAGRIDGEDIDIGNGKRILCANVEPSDRSRPSVLGVWDDYTGQALQGACVAACGRPSIDIEDRIARG